mgnify:FL=1
MSKKESQNIEEQKEKVVTKYDLKMQKRAEEKARAKKEKQVSLITSILIVAALVCFMASFPIRSYLTVHGTYVKVAGENISRLEFDYNYNMALNNYMNQYGTYLSYMGLDLTGDLSTQMYSDSLTFKDFFEKMAVENIIQTKALKAEAKAAGFTYDATKDYEDYLNYVSQAAEAAGMTEKQFVQENFGAYATTSRLKPIVMENLESSAYYDSVSDEKMPSDEDAENYYAENKDSYDSIDYRMTVINAELPTEPTDLADKTEDTTTTDNTTGSTSTDSTTGTDTTTYEPSEAEIAYAMEQAKAEADTALKSIAKDGELKENAKRTSLASVTREWLFDESRKAGDTTVIEDETNNRYYVLAFEKRYLDETPTVDVRAVILSNDGDVSADSVLEEWKSGAATEDSFAELADKYNTASTTTSEGGLFEALSVSNVSDELKDWMTDSSRVQGDTAVIAPEGESYTYVVYFIGTNEAEWMKSIKNTLLTDIMADYLEEITANYSVEDSRNNLNYLKVEAAESAAAAANESASAETDASTESGSTDTTDASTESSSAAQ